MLKNEKVKLLLKYTEQYGFNVSKFHILTKKRTAPLHSFMLFQNDKQPTDAVWREYHDMLYKLIPVARKMVAMGEDF